MYPERHEKHEDFCITIKIVPLEDSFGSKINPGNNIEWWRVENMVTYTILDFTEIINET